MTQYTITFSGLLAQLMSGNGISTIKELHHYLQSKGFHISYPALAAYGAFTSVPSFEKAKEILSLLGYTLSGDELSEILSYSRSELRLNKKDSQSSFSMGLRIPPKYIDENMTVDQLAMALQLRAKDLYQDSGNITLYISGLIKKDLIESGYISK